MSVVPKATPNAVLLLVREIVDPPVIGVMVTEVPVVATVILAKATVVGTFDTATAPPVLNVTASPH